ncbi:MAG TPA: nuclear transport factor 2 family protein [Steroidobacteraceae bacterium]|nr:nuclear transport factor 2 family protein [Steroidobacteraceae bacterium]
MRLAIRHSAATLALLACVSGMVTVAHGADARLAALTSAVSALETRAQSLADVNAIAKLQRAYGYYLSKGYWDEAADLFADDATFESGVDGVYVGKAHIRERLVREGGGSPGPGLPYGQLNERLQLQPVIHVSVDGRRAWGRWRELALLGQFHQRAAWGSGVYENEYAKQDGIWRIVRLHYYPNFVAPYEGGWAHLKPVRGEWITDTGKALPADRPPTVRYQPFPAVFTPPFDYGPQSRVSLAVDADTTTWVRRALDGGDPEVRALASELQRAAQDLARLRSREAISNLQAELGYDIDKGLWSQAAALFTRDGTYEYGQQGVYVGQAHVRTALSLMGPEGLEPGQLNDYPMLQPIIDVAADNRTAKARWRSDVMLSRDGAGEWGGGVYENEYANEGGTWRIRKLHFYVTFFAAYDRGWASGSVPLEAPSRMHPPDRPPSAVYASFPGIYLVPYHYPNPVTGAAPSIEQPVHGLELTPELAALERRVNALGHRVELLKDQAQIEKLQRAYGYYVDKAQWPEIARLFAANGTYEIGGRGVFVGPARVLEYLVTGLGPIGIATRAGQILDHQQFEGIVDVAPDGRTARGRWLALVMGGSNKSSALWGDATYENTYVKENGVWKAASFRAPFTMYCMYRGGWKDSSVPNTRPDSFAPPPDLPPSTVYLTYPSYYVAPFHYPNPVTGHEAPPPDPAAGGTAPMHGTRALP